MAVAQQVGFRHVATALGQDFFLEVELTEVHLETLEIAMLLEELPKLFSSVLPVMPRSTFSESTTSIASHRYYNHGAAGFRLIHLQGLLGALQRAASLRFEIPPKPASEVIGL